MDGLIESLSEVFDITLKIDSRDYLKSNEYTLKYLKYFFLYDDFPKEIRAFIDLLEDIESFVLLFLPASTKGVNEVDIEESLNDLGMQFGQEVKKLTKSNLKHPINQKEGLPLFFDDKLNLIKFLEATEEDRGHLFSFPVIIFPKSLKWYWFFDYDYLNVVHFAYKDIFSASVADLLNKSELVYSENEIKEIRKEAEE